MRDTTRSNSLFDRHSFKIPITFFGLGGINGFIAYNLINLGVGYQSRIIGYDKGKVKPHNLANQVYGCFGERFVGISKAAALTECVKLWAADKESQHPLRFEAHEREVHAPVPTSGIVFMGVDTMSDRGRIFETCVERNPEVLVMIESRMNARYCAVNVVDPNNEHHIKCWKSEIISYTDAQADNEPGCGGHDVVGSTTMAAASIATSLFLKIAAYQRLPIEDNLVPNQFELDLRSFQSWTRVWDEDV
jgi:hypothetical protein